MDCDALYHSAARQQLTLLGGVLGSLIKPTSTVDPALILIEPNIEVVLDGGMRTEKRTVASLLVKEVGKLTRGDKIVIGAKTSDVHELLDDDGYVVRVFLRG
jgi:hypothetical protein